MSSVFQRPLCEMGRAYDFAFRPVLGDADADTGGPCDDYPRPVELRAAQADARVASAEFRTFALCPEHEAQLRRHDGRVPGGSRFREPPGDPTPPAAPSGRRRP